MKLRPEDAHSLYATGMNPFLDGPAMGAWHEGDGGWSIIAGWSVKTKNGEYDDGTDSPAVLAFNPDGVYFLKAYATRDEAIREAESLVEVTEEILRARGYRALND